MLNEAELKVLSAFFPEGIERTTKEIEERSGYSHERVYSTLKSLEKIGILVRKRVGKTLLYYIKKFDDTIYLAFIYYSISRKNSFVERHPSIWKALDEFINKAELDMAILFGSYSKGEAGKRSDVDVLCVGGNTETERIALSLRHKYNIRITPIVITRRDFVSIKTENPEFWEELIKFGIVLKGYELFYELVYRWYK